jgi:dihydroxy-acid dehydratase
MDTEEMISAQPVDACIMIGGCDKTVPAQLMGGISANKPVLALVTGPMMPGSNKGVRLGACTDCRSNWAAYRAGEIDIEEIASVNDELVPTVGTCGVMGTASTMACIAVGLGMMPFNSASAPAVSSARLRVAEETGARAVTVAAEQRRPQSILSKESFLNAITVLQAIGGSTNAIVHLMAIINRHPGVAGSVTLDTFDEIGRKTPLLVDLKPSGDNYMTDFHTAGGMLALMHTLRPLLHLNALTISGKTIGEELDSTPFKPFKYSQDVIRPLSNPLYPKSSLIVLHGNLAPNGAVIKASASKDRRLLSHAGPAVVFKNTADLSERIDDPNLPVTKDSVLILQSIGPIGNPGMPEAGVIPIPRKLGNQGVKDMLRLSDGRMSGTAGGTIVLHISPESAMTDSVFGIIEDGDIIRLEAERRWLEIELTEDVIEWRIRKREESLAKEGRSMVGKRIIEKKRGYRGLYESRVNQAEMGGDFDFLRSDGAKAI